MFTYYGNQPAVIQQLNKGQGFSDKNAKAVTVLGAMQLAVGLLAVIFQSAATGIESTSSRSYKAEFVGCGIWCGIMFMITGLLGIFAGKKKRYSVTVAFLSLNIIISVTVWVLVGFAAANLVGNSFCWAQSQLGSGYYNSENSNYYKDISKCNGEVGRAWQAMDSLLLIIAIFEFAIAVTSAAYCCQALSCCCQGSAQPVFVVQHSASGFSPTYPCGPSLQPAFMQQVSFEHVQRYTNPLMLTHQVGSSAGVASTQTYLPAVQSAMPITPAPALSECIEYTSAGASDPEENIYDVLAPDAPPEYVQVIGTSQHR